MWKKKWNRELRVTFNGPMINKSKTNHFTARHRTDTTENWGIELAEDESESYLIGEWTFKE